jgi:GTP pyrophosphokinase
MSALITGPTADKERAKPLPEALARFTDQTHWTFAKTYARHWPHEYIVREKVDAALFDELAAHIDGHGYESRYYDQKRAYFDHGGHTYWHMDNIINRCPEGETYRRREEAGRLPLTKDVTRHPEFPWPEEPWLLSGRFVDALEAAAVMFAWKDRKGTPIPYITHLLATCAIALQNGADEDQAIAALLHDTIEDIPDKVKAKATVGLFGPEVLRIVEACSDSNTPDKDPWEVRKKRYIERLRQEDQPVLLVSASDKLDNARAIVSDLKKDGLKVWDRFNAPRDRQLWYYGELLKIYKARLKDKEVLVNELERAVAEMSR